MHCVICGKYFVPVGGVKEEIDFVCDECLDKWMQTQSTRAAAFCPFCGQAGALGHKDCERRKMAIGDEGWSFPINFCMNGDGRVAEMGEIGEDTIFCSKCEEEERAREEP